MRKTSPSRFLDELPEEHLDWASKPKKAGSATESKKTADDYLANIQALLKAKNN